MDGRPPASARYAVLVPALLCFGVFVADVALPRGLVVSVAYAPIMYFGLWFARPKTIFRCAYGITVLTLLGWFLKETGNVVFWVVAVNRSISLMALWLATYLVYQYRQAHAALHERELTAMRQEVDSRKALLSTIVESSDDAILSYSLDGVIDSWNDGAQRLLGYSADETIGKMVGILVPEDLRREEASIAAELLLGNATKRFETVRLHKDGRRIDVSITVSPMHGADDYEGAGLGLATCRKIVSRHGGTIWCESAEGRGTTIFFTLQAASNTAIPVTASQTLAA